MKFNCISPRRQTLQFGLLALLVLVPFLGIGDNPLFRLDLHQRTLFLAGMALRIDELFLVLILVLTLLAFFFLITVILGRVWCGWLCPQTVCNDLVELVSEQARKMGASPALVTGSRHLASLVLALLLTAAMLGWFISPTDVMAVIVSPSRSLLASVAALVTASCLYLNMAFVRREFCRSYCPYGRLQTALMDAGTLNLAFREEVRHCCIHCGACVRACPMGIDVRQGFQIECINCGRCIDACRGVMERRDTHEGLIAYRFGESSGGRPRMGTKSLGLLAICVLLFIIGVWSIQGRSDVAFSLQRVATADIRTMADGSQVQAWRAIIGNRRQLPTNFSLRVKPIAGGTFTLLGPVDQIPVDANGNRTVMFSISVKPQGTESGIKSVDVELVREGIVVTVQRIPL